MLHFAPEWCLRQRLGRVAGLRYVTGDLAPGAAQLQLDTTDLAVAGARSTRAGGFQVQRVRLADEFRPEQIRRYGLLAHDELYVCRTPELTYQ